MKATAPMQAMKIAVDFDGTLCEHDFPRIGREVPGAFAVLKELEAAGHKLILNTMRSCGRPDKDGGDTLTEAVRWCADPGRDIAFYGVNENPEQKFFTSSPKVYAQLYIDEAALGCPLRSSSVGNRLMVDWMGVRTLLVLSGVLPMDAATQCAERFAAKPWLRAAWKCSTDNKSSAQYRAALELYTKSSIQSQVQ